MSRERLYKIGDIAEICRCEIQTIYNKISRGEIPRPIKTKVGKRYTEEGLQDVLRIIIEGPSNRHTEVVKMKRPRGRPRLSTKIRMEAKDGKENQ